MQRIQRIDEYVVAIKSHDDLDVGCVKVTRSQLEGMLKDLDDFRPELPRKFEVGDHVRLTEEYYGYVRDDHGTVTELCGRAMVKVEFDNPRGPTAPYIFECRLEKASPFVPGAYVHLTRTFNNRGEYSRVNGTIGSGPIFLETERLTTTDTQSYGPQDLDIVSEEEYRRNVTLQVGDTVRIIRPDSRFVGQTATIREIGSFYHLEFDTADSHRAVEHIHKLGERHGHVWSTRRENIELVG
jgi:hypothetical protein